jgi:ribonuclease P protein component
MRWYASLRRPAEFARVRRRGKRAAFPTLNAFSLARRRAPSRIGITTPSAIGGAVVRNLLRRRVRGALDALSAQAADRPAACDLVLVLRPESAAAPYAALARDVAAALALLPAAAP